MLATLNGTRRAVTMFEQLDEPPKTTQVSTAMTFGILVAYLAGAFGAFLLFIFLGDKRYGTQITTIIVYTYFAFWYVFFPTRGLLEKYSLRNTTVQRQIPRLLAIHCAFLILIVFGQTLLLEMKPHLPAYWFAEERGGRGAPLYFWVMFIPPIILFWAQVLISRRILSSSLKENCNEGF